MTVGTSIKELSKAITAFIPDPRPVLPKELIEVIDAFLRKHKGHDDGCKDTLQEELLSVYRKHVENMPARIIAFLAIIRTLTPHLQSLARLTPWMDVGCGLIDSLFADNNLMVDTSAWMQDFLTLGEHHHGQDTSENHQNPLLERLVSLWVTEQFDASIGGIDPGWYDEQVMRNDILQFGRKKPKSLFLVLDKLLLKRTSRKATLALLGDLIQNQPPHLHSILDTSLFSDLLRCLQLDTSTTVVSAALTVLIMLLPNMPNSLVPHLPTLFSIYTRLLFWFRDRSTTSDTLLESAEAKSPAAPSFGSWEVYTYVVEHDSPQMHRVANYFTMLYGLYPINFTEYIRKPQRYIRQVQASLEKEVEVTATELQQKSESFRQCHVLHPNFYTMTAESERTDFDRWRKSEPADIATECIALCLLTDPPGRLSADFTTRTVTDVGVDMELAPSVIVSSNGDRDDTDPSLLMRRSTVFDAWHDSRMASASTSGRAQPAVMRCSSQSSHMSLRDALDPRLVATAHDSPTLPASLDAALALIQGPNVNRNHHAQIQLQDMIHSNKMIKLAIQQSLPNGSVPSLALSHQDSITDAAASQIFLADEFAPIGGEMRMGMDTPAGQIVHLQRQLNLLQNDLRFERYMRRLHAARIGSLRHRHMIEIASETETQNLLLTNRHLKNRLEEAKKAEIQVRRESEKIRSLSQKREEDVCGKLRVSREETKRALIEREQAHQELEEALRVCHELKEMIRQSEGRELALHQTAQDADMDSHDMKQLRAEVGRLEAVEREHATVEVKAAEAQRKAVEAERKAVELELKLEAREGELSRTRGELLGQIAVLRSRVLETEDDRRGRGNGGVMGNGRDALSTALTGTAVSDSDAGSAAATAMLENALTASRAKYSDLQQQYSLLTRKYSGVQSALLDMRSGAVPGRQTGLDSPSADGGSGSGTMSPVTASGAAGSPSSARYMPRSHAMFADPDFLEATSYNVTPPLQALPLSPGDGTETPEQRLSGWGGLPIAGGLHVATSRRKDGKDKKKDKKIGGLRAIRGF